MNTSLALYEALLQANVPAPAARRAAEALEADMTQHLATKQDLAHTNALMAKGFEAVNQRFDAVDQRFAAIDQRFASIDQRFDALDKILEVRFAALKAEIGATQTELEGRLLKKLSAIMTFLLAAMMGLQAMLR